ncbi:MAG: hypothetical protein M3457_01160 [Chloroflexota bacterium]|nr:hypothetical protein [Chloroflexota bacterium]
MRNSVDRGYGSFVVVAIHPERSEVELQLVDGDETLGLAIGVFERMGFAPRVGESYTIEWELTPDETPRPSYASSFVRIGASNASAS